MFNFTSLKRISHLLIAISLFATILFVPKPVAAQVTAPNPEAEAYLLSELRAYGYADLSVFPEGDRGVSGYALGEALKDPEVLDQSFIVVTNATVTDDLYALGLIIPTSLLFSNMEFAGTTNFMGTQLQSFEAFDSKFTGDVNFSDTSIIRFVKFYNNDFNGTVYFGTSVIDGYTNITNNTIKGSMSFLRATLNGNVDLRDNVINESLNFYGAHVSGELLLDGSQILGTEAMPGTSYPTEFWNATVDGLASFTSVYFKGNLIFSGSEFKGLAMDGATFDGTTDFTNLHTENDTSFNSTTFNSYANFGNASTARDANFIGATFNGEANFNYFTAERFVDFTNATFNQAFWFNYTIVPYPYFDNTVFNGFVSFEGLQASQAFDIINSSYNYAEKPLIITLANIGGAVNLTELTAPAGLLLSDSHFGSLSITTKDNPEITFIDITGTDIDSDLLIDKVAMQSFLAEGSSIGKSTTLTQVNITRKMDLRNASIGFLKVDDKLDYPDNPESFILRGMTYLDIDLGDQGLTKDTWLSLLKLVNESAYSPQAYQALAQFLTDKGHPDWAAEVELAQNHRERDQVLTRFSGPWFWSWFLAIFSGYGHRPAYAFIWSGLVIAMGAFAFRRKEDMLPVDQDSAQLEYNPIWYSFSLFIPYIDLGIASKWEPNPERKWARNYKYIHMILGWVLAPIALLTFSGVLG